MGLGITDAFLIDIGSPASLTVAASPKIYNFSEADDQSYLIANLTNPLNSTGDPANIFDDSSDVSIFQPWTIIDYIDMAFIVNVMNAFSSSIGIEFPSEFMNFFYGIGGLLFGLFVLFLITGRSIPGLT